ncbi:NAD(P)-binding protein [Cucurbitaria berberidis CBS 394.84]|uniref:NAD(P)-binding protein n=1 Tax=Cucurbitaria berberidis CBS 394.84 TaxID=1168544 RepID=A0A9P4L7U6_9PLEO|nr:NAD(P)-binding protein [Cucurbitaria berberidis CBS 394.84]KAF1845360.1 NAD(P)-binding protein [Cucurbitaria berberidis CBS 394.84]
MSSLEDIPTPDNGFYVLVTGANSGLGLGIGKRLIDEFLQTRPQSESLVLIVTTRDQRKGDATIENLQQHLRKVIASHERKLPGIAQVLQHRIFFRQERLDLLSLVSVQKLCRKLRETTPKLDVVICNAGIGGWTGINWPLAVYKILTSWSTAVCWPTFKISGVGWVAKPQIPAEMKVEEPPLGEVFCANFFGHYLLGHYLAPLLAKHPRSENTKGRIIWVSSLEAYEHVLDLNDIQGIGSTLPYEATKRLTDVMAITSALPSTCDVADEYLDQSQASEKTTKPRIYVTHPGICGTSIVALPLILEYLMFTAFYVARWLGSQWHPVTVDKGACAMVWLALAQQDTLDNMEEKEGVGKWGSATDFWGQERAERTEVAWWGWGGKSAEYKRKKGRDPYAKDATKESRERFLETGRKCWEEMERLRIEWEGRLRRAGVGIEME